MCQTFFLSERSKVTKQDGFKGLKKTVKRARNERSQRLIRVMDSLEYKKWTGKRLLMRKIHQELGRVHLGSVQLGFGCTKIKVQLLDGLFSLIRFDRLL